MPPAARRAVIASMADLSDNETLLGDDIILAVAHAIRDSPPLTNKVRTRMWNAVFKNWDSSRTARHPGPIPKRKRVKTSMLVGNLTIAAPLKAGSPIPDYRQAGSPVYLRPALGGKNGSINPRFDYIDKKRNQVPIHSIEITVQTRTTMHSDAVKHFDYNEAIRVSSYNKKLAIYWLRCRVLALVKNVPGHFQLSINARPENKSELTVLHLIADFVIRMRQINFNSVRAIRGEGF